MSATKLTPPAGRGRARPTAAHFFGAEASLTFAVMEDEATPDADQTPAEKAAVMIQRMHRQNSFTSEDSDEKARRQWVNFHLANGQYEEASLWDGTAISKKLRKRPHPIATLKMLKVRQVM